MGVSTDVWQQRIGCFRQRPPSTSRLCVEVDFSSSPPIFGMGSYTYMLILFGVIAGAMLMPDITVYGDVEKNPGPATPQIPDDLLTSLKNGTCTSTADFKDDLRMKHILQLRTKKEEKQASGWAQIVEWMKLFYPTNDFQDNKKWQRLLQESFNKVKKMYTELNKNTHRETGLTELSEWMETPYQLPTPKPTPQPDSQTSSTSSTASLFELQVAQAEIKKLKDANTDLQTETQELKNQVESLKERPSPHTEKNTQRREREHLTKINTERERVKELEKKQSRLKKQVDAVKAKKRNLKSEFETAAKVAKQDLETRLESLGEYSSELEDQVTTLREKVNSLMNTNNDLLEEIERLTLAVHEAKDKCVIFFDEENRCFYPFVHKCVWNLISKHVSFANVSDVISIVLDSLNISYDKLPSESTIRNMNKDRTLVSQIQTANLAEKENTTISTDETPHAGDIYMTYAIRDDDGQDYLLGLRQMKSKSAEHTLETLKDTLNDITDICHKANAGDDVGQRVLCQIRNTMSDRAATETLFNKMLQAYREEILPLYTENWHHFSDTAKEKLTEMYNFFCGLHLLVSMADGVSEALKSFEADFLDGKKIGAEADPGIRVFNSWSGTVRLIQNVCKALSRGGDEKSGCHRAWKVYKSDVKLDKTYFVPFRGNRFNVIFMFGGRAYFLNQHVQDFFTNVHGTSNGLLKAVLLDSKESLFIAGCKVLGIINKTISAPIWRITEHSKHIMDMCQVYTGLVDFLTKLTTNEDLLADFAYGRLSYFDEQDLEKDEVYDSVLSPGAHDEIVFNRLQQVLLTLNQLFKRILVEYLPGGKFFKMKDDQEFRQMTASAPLHNKLPERVFGYLDFLIKKRPNSSAAANEAQVLYTFNKTAEFVDGKTDDELADLVKVVKSQREQRKKTEKERQEKIFAYWQKKQEDTANAMKETKRRALVRKENLTNDIADTGLFQSPDQLEEYLNSQNSERQKYEVIKKQIRFRRDVLSQFMEGDKGFTYTTASKENQKKRINKPVSEMKAHLLKLINAASSVGGSQSVQKTPDNDHLTVPLLVGKKVKHLWNTEDGEEWFNGTVISQVPGFPAWYNITYDEDPKVYSLRLVDDYRDKTLSILV